MTYRTVTITPEIHSSIVEVTADIYDGTISADAEFSMPVKIYNLDPDYYEGPYEYTPTQDTQTVSINGLMASQDITINPIPSNYGLITYDGAILTVS